MTLFLEVANLRFITKTLKLNSYGYLHGHIYNL